ncbi:hypothetical protein JW935_06410, partial [candidate division KSB1 bacterium]|nr:hypothetical protein [candidate division KSB1 bacterium]
MDITVKAIDLFSVLNALFYLNPRPGYCDGTWLVIHKQNGEVFFTTENQQGRFSIKLKTVSISGSTGISLPYLPLFHALRTIADDTIVRMLWPETGKATFCKILFSGISIKIHAKNPSILKTEEKQLDRWPVLPDTACFRKIETILPFVSRDEFRTAMRGVFVEEDGFVATNGAVLAKLPARTGLDKILLPMFAVRILLNIPHFPAETRFRTGHKSGNMYITMMSRSFYFNFFLSPDRFPEYKRLFPRDYTTKFICFRKDLLEKIAVLQALQINFTD